MDQNNILDHKINRHLSSKHMIAEDIKKNYRLDIIDHIAIQVSDIQKTLDWYLKQFCCKEIYSDDTWALIEFKNVKLALVKSSEHPAHFAILDNEIIKKKDTVMHRDGSISKYIKDYSSNYIELITYKSNKDD